MGLITIKKIDEAPELRRKIRELKNQIEELEDQIYDWQDFGRKFFEHTGLHTIMKHLDLSKFNPKPKKRQKR